MKPLYIVGTERNIGKTTFCIGLISALRERGVRIGYTKPLGQRITTVAGEAVHDDALVISRAMGIDIGGADSATVALTRGRVEKEIFDLRSPQLAERIVAVAARLQADNDLVVVEGMGNVAMGSCLKLSGADIARILGARPLLIGGGGIGRAIDEIAICETFLAAHDAPMIGVAINKVWPAKYDRVRGAVTRGLANLDIRCFGTVPYQDVLASPTVGQVAAELGGEVVCGRDALGSRVGKTIVAAMEAEHMVSYLTERSLVITPGDRSDNILAIVSAHVLPAGEVPPVSGIILTGGIRPADNVMRLLAESRLPAVLFNEDTYTLAARLRDTLLKITPDDTERIDAAMHLVNRYVDVDGIVEALEG